MTEEKQSAVTNEATKANVPARSSLATRDQNRDRLPANSSPQAGFIRRPPPRRDSVNASAGRPEDADGSTSVITKPKSQTKTPSLYRVILMNDDFTPMDFVILVLQKIFNKDLSEATQIMLAVHSQGAGICGVFTYEIAETKVHQVNQFARQNRHPLKCTMEKV